MDIKEYLGPDEVGISVAVPVPVPDEENAVSEVSTVSDTVVYAQVVADIADEDESVDTNSTMESVVDNTWTEYRHDEIPVHVIQSGETLEAVSQEEFGSYDYVQRIMDMNGLLDHAVFEGQILKLPKE